MYQNGSDNFSYGLKLATPAATRGKNGVLVLGAGSTEHRPLRTAPRGVFGTPKNTQLLYIV